MSRIPRSNVTRNGNELTILFDEQTSEKINLISSKVEEISATPLHKPQVNTLFDCMVKYFFRSSNNIAKLEDWICSIANFLEMYAEALKGDTDNE